MDYNKKKLKIVLSVAFFVFLVSFNIYINTGQRLVNRFQAYVIKLYEDNPCFLIPKFLGVFSQQFPSDLWVMQEIIYEINPDFIVEIGTAKGGTALFYATILEKVNEDGKIITIDIMSLNELAEDTQSGKVCDMVARAQEYKIWKERVIFINGNCEDPEVVDKIAKMVKGKKVLILLDAGKEKAHVLKNLRNYSSLISVGSYIVVHDTICQDVMEAVQQFLNECNNFQIDHSRERFLITLSPQGFLKRIR